MDIVFNILISVVVISLTLWVSKTNPTLAGFIVALPITTLIVLALSKIQNTNEQNSVEFAKSIFVGVPVSLLFFVPFLLSEKLKLSFWTCYVSGVVFLAVGFFIHKSVTDLFYK